MEKHYYRDTEFIIEKSEENVICDIFAQFTIHVFCDFICGNRWELLQDMRRSAQDLVISHYQKVKCDICYWSYY